MIFNSPIFLFAFLPFALALYFVIPARLKNLFLVIASLFFYTWGEGELVLLLVFSVFFNYISGLLLDRYKNTRTADIVLYVAVIANVGGLVFYKYTNFLAENFNVLLSSLNLKTIVIDQIYFPLGISFYTFQALSYIFDVYREEAPAETNPLKAAFYMTFFPKLISGPIIKYSEMKPQIDAPSPLTTDDVYEGMKRFIIGLAKKVILADNLAVYANAVFSETPGDLSAITVWTGTMMFGLQMYFDFSGYTDMAIGAGRMFGYRLPENFNFPYAANSISAFWRRWHITLSFWFRDYFYTPLSLKLAYKWNPRFAIGFSVFIAFITIGLWHGAAWNFVLFGLIHAIFIVWEMTYGQKIINRWWKPLQHFYAIAIIVVSSVFFRAPDIKYAIEYLGQMFYGGFTGDKMTVYILPLSVTIGITSFILALPLTHTFLKKIGTGLEGSSIIKLSYPVLTVLALIALLYICVLFVASAGYTPFIYFQF